MKKVLALLLLTTVFFTGCKENPNKVSNITEIGWKPIIGEIKHENQSGVAFATFSMSGDTHEKAAFRHCFVATSSELPRWWRTNPSSGHSEAFILLHTGYANPHDSVYLAKRFPANIEWNGGW